MSKSDWEVQLAFLVDMKCPQAVFEEVKYNFINNYNVADFTPVRHTFNDFNDLYEGKYPGYRACNTRFHDKIHTTDALVAISRMIDGYNLKNSKIPVNLVRIAHIATILHDTGYIQDKRDTHGTGAKYTLSHVDRSIGFMQKYFSEKGFSKKNFISAKNMVQCTGLTVNIENIKFSSKHERTLGLMLGAADLLGQMGSRTYLERLIYLYREFREGQVKGYSSEFNLLEKTLEFYRKIRIRLSDTLENVGRYMKPHFAKRYNIKEDLYEVAIARQISYLDTILKNKSKIYRDELKRQI
jgi:hypothetical protein